MSMFNNHQVISYLYQQNVALPMIKILEEQRIGNDDLQTIDRDDIEHLFKNELGFIFRDRKTFWNAIQKFRSTNTKNDLIYVDQHTETPDVYDIIDDEPSNYSLTQRYVPIASSNILTPVRMYNTHNFNIQENTLEVITSEEEEDDDDDSAQTATTSLPACAQSVRNSPLKKSSDIQFQLPIELPTFSSKVMRAFETNNIHNEWTTFIDELALWTVSKKHTPITRREYRTIGQAVFKRYPGIVKDGFRPWSYLCKCLTQRIRKLKKKCSKK